MHGMNDQVDMRRFGRLSGAMKVTWMTFGLGWLAILGIPPFAGFWSKDKIIESAFAVGGTRLDPRPGHPHRCRHHRLLHVAAVLP
jgi:NADH-quinone oxidoreductase subunit L